jgi:hypothetical protein
MASGVKRHLQADSVRRDRGDMTSDQATDSAARPSQRAWTAAVVFWTFLLLGVGAVRFLVGGVANLILGPGWQERALGLLLLGLAAASGYALKGWFEGRRKAWFAALVLLPATAATLLWDDQRTGEVTGSDWLAIVGPALATWLLLLLPSVRSYFGRR